MDTQYNAYYKPQEIEPDGDDGYDPNKLIMFF